MAYKVSEEVRQFLTPVREFTLHNAADEPIIIMYSGETRILPAANEISYPHPKFDDVCFSAKDEDGDWIPGTLVFRDVVQTYMNDQEGQVWSAANAIRHALDINVKSGVASGKYAERGVSLLPPSPDKALVKRLVHEGRQRFVAWRYKWAKEVAEGYESRIAALKAAGHAPIPLGADYDRARAILDAGREQQKEKYAADYPVAGAPVVRPQVEPEGELLDKDELLELLKSKMTGVSASTPEDLVAQLTSNPEAMRLFRTKYKVRKHRDNKAEALP